jgi:hypothetical protein
MSGCRTASYEPVGLLQDVLRAVCSVDSREAAFRVDHPHQERTGIEPVTHFRAHVAGAVAGGEHLHDQIRSELEKSGILASSSCSADIDVGTTVGT